jgi:hypothetical protein
MTPRRLGVQAEDDVKPYLIKIDPNPSKSPACRSCYARPLSPHRGRGQGNVTKLGRR